MSTLLRNQNPGRVRTKHVDRIVEALEKMEIKAGIRIAISARDVETTAAEPGNVNSAPDPSMPDLIRAAHKLGFEVCFRPL
jgi:3'-phosphoadenosine 5'-phosphosulfate sulfotransferase